MDSIDKKSLSERDICTQFITPNITAAGWDLHAQVREEVTFTDGRVIVKGRSTARGPKKRADYVLYYKPGIPLAIVEAKDNKHTVGAGMQQALSYSHEDCLDVPFAISSNGDGFLIHDRTRTYPETEFEIPLGQFPTPDDLWQRYLRWRGIDDQAEQIVDQDFHDDGSGKSPRYYQTKAINRSVEAIASGKDRVLLVMATGTGKTYTAFQIIWRLWKSGAKKRILFLADRNILVDQTKTNDFKPFGGAMTKIRNRKADKSFEIFLSLYQAITGPEESDKVYKEFSPDFFDLIVIDECHRGSAKDDSAWREVLDYFSSATHLGMTATPKETQYVSNIHYFGDPIYTYSLRQGIDDGFLAPYKVIRVDIDKDLQGWRPTKGQLDKHGNLIEDRIYNQKDFDKSLVLEPRTQLVAQRITEFLQATNPYDKTIVFCDDIDHAERMRQALVNCNPELVGEDDRYVVRITGDNKEGKEQLDFFIDPESRYPVIATTSKLMTTGVDAKTCKLVVLDQRIQSMTEFKQIIGRGTRIDEDYDKLFFTIMDFKKATELFADPDFDGDPIPDEDYDPLSGGKGTDGDPSEGDTDGDDPPPPQPGVKKYYVLDTEVSVVAERIQYYGPDGKLITESLRDYTKKKVMSRFASMDEFLLTWNAADKKAAIMSEFEEQGVLFEALADDVGKDLDPFDLLCHVVYGQPPLTRRERAENVKKRDYFTKYGTQARAVLEALLEKYANQGILAIESMDVLKVDPLDDMGTPVEIIKLFGGKDAYLAALKDLETQLYASAS
ncbi:EcoAI/FtnUII family type I restriction enzme subunit R [Rhodopirellula bahusiensis]|uniref:EcoAI/FtnUII family type I restriction enzme subunit R n=1 Tax=Rhodopirellula bahusiensis TaxID=2014065 RepID=UPI0018EA6E4B|nr:DEAD/DEAH box helicase family protein [Rhodopirellula bahusiensis]